VSIRAARFGFLIGAALLAGNGGEAWVRSAAAASTAANGHPVAGAVRLGGDVKQTRFVVDLSRRVGINAFILANPYRVVIDLPQVVFRLPTKAGDEGRGLVKAFRYGLVMLGGSRIVLDLAGPARIEKAFSLDAAAGQPARLVLELAATDRDSFMRALALDNRVARVDSGRKIEKVERAAGDTRPVIVIDPGHGGIDEGTHAANNVTEKAIVLEFGKRLRDRLQKTGKYRVLMTRSDDQYVPLADRVRFARTNKAALFISVHADALPRTEGDARGASIYTLSDTASDAEAARLAEKENRADVIAGVDLNSEPSDVADILIDLAQRETRAFSTQFARTLSGELKNVARMHKNPLKSAGFRVLKAPDVPSVLIELGYVSNRSDLKQITSNTWQSRTSDAIVQAVGTYFLTQLAGAVPGGALKGA
jgi:N-acetylmuramoyl-L-alanine amidase